MLGQKTVKFSLEIGSEAQLSVSDFLFVLAGISTPFDNFLIKTKMVELTARVRLFR